MQHKRRGGEEREKKRELSKLQTKWSSSPTDNAKEKEKKDGVFIYKYYVLAASTRREREKRKGERKLYTYTTAIARVRRNNRRVFSSMLFAVVLFYRRERSEVRLLPTPLTPSFFFLLKQVHIRVLWDEKPSRKKRKERKKKPKSYYISILARVLSSHVHSSFFFLYVSFLSFCVVNGKTTREIARLRQLSYSPSAHIGTNSLI